MLSPLNCYMVGVPPQSKGGEAVYLDPYFVVGLLLFLYSEAVDEI